MENDVVVGQVDDVDGNPHADGVHPPTRNDPKAAALRESRKRLPDQADEARPMGLGNGEPGGQVLAARTVECVAEWCGLRHRDSQTVFTTENTEEHGGEKSLVGSLVSLGPFLPSVLSALTIAAHAVSVRYSAM